MDIFARFIQQWWPSIDWQLCNCHILGWFRTGMYNLHSLPILLKIEWVQSATIAFPHPYTRDTYMDSRSQAGKFAFR